jgi:hypothetical protein
VRTRLVTLTLALSLQGCVKITTDDEPRASRGQLAEPTPAPRPPEVVAPPADPDAFAVREPVAAEPVGVTLLDAGSEPREALRVGAVVGARRKLRVELGLSVTMRFGDREVGPTSLPALQVALDTEVVSSDAERTTIAIAVTEVVVPSEASSSTRVRNAIASTAEALRATKGQIVLADDGRIEGFELAAAADAARAGSRGGLEPELGGLAAALQEMLPVVPREPIGDGARWRSVQHVRRDTVTLQQIGTWTAKRAGDGWVLSASSEHVVLARPSDAQLEDPAQRRVVEAQSGTTQVRAQWGSAGALPRSAEAQVSTTTRANLEQLGAGQRASMRVELSLGLADSSE